MLLFKSLFLNLIYLYINVYWFSRIKFYRKCKMAVVIFLIDEISLKKTTFGSFTTVTSTKIGLQKTI